MLRALAFVFVWLLAAPSAQAVTALKLISTPGDYIGQGETTTYRAPRTSIAVSGTASHASVSVDGVSGWTLEFASPANTALTATSYPSAARYPFNSPLGAGMSVYGQGRGCNTLKGWFRVLEIATNSSGEIVKLAIDFEQNCETTMPPLYGAIRYNSGFPLEVPTLQAVAGPDFSVFSGQTATLDGTQSFNRRGRGRTSYQWVQLDGPAVVLAGPATAAPSFTAPAVGIEGVSLHFRLDVADNNGNMSSDDVVVLVKNASAPTTLVSFRGDAGDYVTQGRSYNYDRTNAQIVFSRNFDNGVSIAINGATWWTLDTAVPNNGSFVVGTYTNAQRFPFQAPNTPGLDLSGDGRGCNTLTGQFTVHQVQFDSGGTPQVLDLTFEQHCEGASAAAYGQVLLNAAPAAQVAKDLRAARRRYGLRQ